MALQLLRQAVGGSAGRSEVRVAYGSVPRSDQVLVKQEKTLQEECVQNDYV